MPAGRVQRLTPLVDSSGGVASATDTIVDVPAAYAEANVAAQLATLTRKINQIIAVVKAKAL